MSQFRFNKVAALPAVLAPNNIYLVQPDPDSPNSEYYFTGNDSVARQIASEQFIRMLAADEVANALSAGFMFQIVETIADRDALTLTDNSLVLVNDASADPTVTSGAALYSFNLATGAYGKLSEFEGLDATIVWSNIQGRPTSAIADIDDAVNKRHTHTNMMAIDKLNELPDGTPSYNGDAIFTIGTQDW